MDAPPPSRRYGDDRSGRRRPDYLASGRDCSPRWVAAAQPTGTRCRDGSYAPPDARFLGSTAMGAGLIQPCDQKRKRPARFPARAQHWSFNFSNSLICRIMSMPRESTLNARRKRSKSSPSREHDMGRMRREAESGPGMREGASASRSAILNLENTGAAARAAGRRRTS
jgi:hypothetical protein